MVLWCSVPTASNFLSRNGWNVAGTLQRSTAEAFFLFVLIDLPCPVCRCYKRWWNMKPSLLLHRLESAPSNGDLQLVTHGGGDGFHTHICTIHLAPISAYLFVPVASPKLQLQTLCVICVLLLFHVPTSTAWVVKPAGTRLALPSNIIGYIFTLESSSHR